MTTRKKTFVPEWEWVIPEKDEKRVKARLRRLLTDFERMARYEELCGGLALEDMERAPRMYDAARARLWEFLGLGK